MERKLCSSHPVNHYAYIQAKSVTLSIRKEIKLISVTFSSCHKRFHTEEKILKQDKYEVGWAWGRGVGGGVSTNIRAHR